MYALPNGDVLVAESNSNFPLVIKIGAVFVAQKSKSMRHSADRITLLRDANHDVHTGVPQHLPFQSESALCVC